MADLFFSLKRDNERDGGLRMYSVRFLRTVMGMTIPVSLNPLTQPWTPFQPPSDVSNGSIGVQIFILSQVPQDYSGEGAPLHCSHSSYWATHSWNLPSVELLFLSQRKLRLAELGVYVSIWRIRYQVCTYISCLPQKWFPNKGHSAWFHILILFESYFVAFIKKIN